MFKISRRRPAVNPDPAYHPAMEKVVVLLYRNEAPAEGAAAPDDTAEFVFPKAAKDFARQEVDEGRAKRAVVKNREGDVILTYPPR